MADQSPKLDSVFLAALEIDSPEERAAYLDNACAHDEQLRADVEQMLAAQGKIASFLESPPSEFEATIVHGGGHRDLAASLEAGLAPTFGEDAAVVMANAGHSVLKSLGKSIDVPRVALRESRSERPDPITRPQSPEMPQGKSDSRYQLQGEIARGGMGAIIKGRDNDLGRELAIKVLLDQHKDKPEVIQRFVEEAQIGGQLQHPGIAPIYELGQFSDKRPFFSMKLVKGETLSKLLAQRKDPAEERGRILGIFEQVCQTMAYAHSRGVIHRDLKPANIMVGAFGEVQVMDWGLAKVLSAGGIADEKKARDTQLGKSIIQTLRSGPGSDAPGTFGAIGSQTQMGSVMGTPAYMPPEQALGEIDNLDERADVFGLGAILCEILTGKPPYVADDGTQVYRMASRGKLSDCFARLDGCGADADLIALTKHCLELEPSDRPRDAGVLAERVAEYLESVETKLRETELSKAAETARAEEALHTAREQEAAIRAQRRVGKLLYAIAALLLVGLVTAGLLARHSRSLEKTQRTLALEKTELAARNEQLANDREAERNAAVAARDAESEQRRIAEDARRSEANLRALAENREQTIRKSLYSIEMNLAGQAAQEASGIRRVLELTNRWNVGWQPGTGEVNLTSLTPSLGPPQDAAELAGAQRDLRGWEWYYLSSLCNQARLSLPFGAAHVDWSPDGRHIAGAAGGQVHIWDSWNGALHKQFGASDLSVTYNSDGTKIAAAGYDGLVRIYEANTGALLTTLRHEFAELRSISWSPDGQMLAMGLWDQQKGKGEVSLWDTLSGARIHSIPAEPILGRCDWSPDGTRLVVNGYIYDANTLEVTSAPAIPLPLAGSSQFSPRGNLFAMATLSDIEVRDSQSSEIKVRLTGHLGVVRSICWNPDGKLIASGAEDDSIRIWDVDSGSELLKLRGHKYDVGDVKWSRDGKQLISTDGETIKVWDYEALRTTFSPQERPYGIRTLAWDAEGEILAAGGSNGLHLFDSETGETLAHATSEQAGSRSQFSPTLAWNSVDRTIAIIHGESVLLLNGHSLEQQRAWTVPHSSNATLGLSPDGAKLAVALANDSSGIKVYDKSTGTDLLTALESRMLVSVCWSPDSSRIACGAHSHGYVLDGTTGAVICQLNSEKPTNWMNSVAWSPSGDLIAAACANQMIVVFDAATGALQQTLLGHSGGVECIAWSPDGTRLASCSNDKTVRVWDPKEGGLLLTLNGHDAPVTSVAWSPDGVRLASASYDGTVRIWDAYAGYRSSESPRVLATLNRRLEENPDRIDVLRLRSKIFEQLGSLALAQQDLERVVQNLLRQHAASPNDLAPLQQLAELSVDMKNWTAATSAYSKLILLEPSESTWLVKRAAAYVACGQSELAKADLWRALECSPDRVSEKLATQLFDLVLAPSAAEWTVIEPVEMHSSGGATLNLQKDGSILASGENPDQDDYTLVARPSLDHITAIRLEALLDPSLPQNGPGRSTDFGNFHLNELSVRSDGKPVSLTAIATLHDEIGEAPRVIDGKVDEAMGWSNHPRMGEPNSAIFATELQRNVDGDLQFDLHFSRNAFKQHGMGRFRLSVSGDPAIFDRERKRLAARKISDGWGKLAAACQIVGDHSALTSLLEKHPGAMAGLADLLAAEHKWEQAIAAYSQLINGDTTDISLLGKRAEAYIATEQWEAAKADWTRTIELNPEQLHQAFDRFCRVEQWATAADFGQQLIQRESDLPSWRWMHVPTILVLAGDRDAYADVCGRMLREYSDSQVAEDAERTIKVSLLWPKVVDLHALPVDRFTRSIDDGTMNPAYRSWFWATRALLAYRQANSAAVIEYVGVSEENDPAGAVHAMNLALLALAHNELNHANDSRMALVEASETITSLRKVHQFHNDLLIAEILYREAEAKISGSDELPNMPENH